ncbi:hypothetical protein TNIN_17481 [Trichonephila inaurata madagascariensis]|uniref:Transposase n=1 Tax=Trichonephila inaurata madagascariensis TaxID=2747483 RepID=A0A8X6KKD4_9ARAC|nr:hypothetical protein TNIN_17481 [Trichonephila inaurata madagascariensis]
MRGGSLMVWLTVVYVERISLFLNGSQNHEEYVQVFESELFNNASQAVGESRVYQEDDAPIHTANAAKNCFFSPRNIRVLPWPAKNSDISHVKNFRAMLV